MLAQGAAVSELPFCQSRSANNPNVARRCILIGSRTLSTVASDGIEGGTGRARIRMQCQATFGRRFGDRRSLGTHGSSLSAVSLNSQLKTLNSSSEPAAFAIVGDYKAPLLGQAWIFAFWSSLNSQLKTLNSSSAPAAFAIVGDYKAPLLGQAWIFAFCSFSQLSTKTLNSSSEPAAFAFRGRLQKPPSFGQAWDLVNVSKRRRNRMKKYRSSKSAFFNSRVLVGLAFCSIVDRLRVVRLCRFPRGKRCG